MMLEAINKVLTLLFFMATLNAVRHVYYFIQLWFTQTEENTVKYRLNNSSLFLLNISIAYIATVMMRGITI